MLVLNVWICPGYGHVMQESGSSMKALNFWSADLLTSGEMCFMSEIAAAATKELHQTRLGQHFIIFSCSIDSADAGSGCRWAMIFCFGIYKFCTSFHWNARESNMLFRRAEGLLGQYCLYCVESSAMKWPDKPQPNTEMYIQLVAGSLGMRP